VLIIDMKVAIKVGTAVLIAHQSKTVAKIPDARCNRTHRQICSSGASQGAAHAVHSILL
jgi:hypothetical protein